MWHRALGHEPMYPGSRPWTRKRTGLAHRLRAEAGDTSHASLLDAREAIDPDPTDSWELAGYPRVPEKVVALQAPVKLDNG